MAEVSKRKKSFGDWSLLIGYYLEFGLPARSPASRSLAEGRGFGEGRDLVIGIYDLSAPWPDPNMVQGRQVILPPGGGTAVLRNRIQERVNYNVCLFTCKGGKKSFGPSNFYFP